MSVTQAARYGTTGATAYWYWSNSAGQVWDYNSGGTGSATAPNTNWTSGRQITLASESPSYLYTVTVPSNLPAGDWTQNFVIQLGGSPSWSGDLLAATGTLRWDGANELFFSQNWTISGVNLGAILGTIITGTAANIVASFKLFFNVASPALTTASVNQTGDSYARLGAPAGASTAADIAAVNAKTTNLPAAPASTTNITGGTITTVTNLTNAPTAGDFTATMKTSLNAATPASVTGAVGSVTGNVGGNVVGSVASVTAAIVLPTGTGAGQIALSSGQVLVQSGTGTGQLSVTAGVIAATVAGVATSNSITTLQTTATGIATTLGSAGAGLTGIPAVTLAASQPNYAPALASVLATDVSALTTAIGTPAQASNLAALVTTVGVAGAGLTALASATNLATVETHAANADTQSAAAESALNALTNSGAIALSNIVTDITAVGTTATNIYGIVNSGTYGNAALLTAIEAAGGWTSTITESYATLGAAMTPAQALYSIFSILANFSINGTTLTTTKLDGETTALTLTLNSATAPTALTRSG